MLQAYVDDSGRGNPPVFVLAGLVASAAAWAEFSDVWDETLKSDPPLEFLKMKKYMKMDPWRDERADIKLSKLYALQAIMNRYVEYGIVVAVSTWEYREILSNVSPKVWRSEYYFMVGAIIRQIIENDYKNGRKQSVDFIFDRQMNEESTVHLAWSRAQSGQANARIRRRMGSLTYGCDTKIRPLQAADMVAWLYRKMAADLLGDAGLLYPELKGRPLYDPSILSMGLPQKMLSAENAGDIGAGDAEALALRLSSKSWPGGRMLQVPVQAFYVNKSELVRTRDALMSKGGSKHGEALSGRRNRLKRPRQN